MSREHLAAFAAKLTHDDHIVIEATGNAQAVVEAVAQFVGRVVIANPRQVHLIAKARIKTDVIDATVLARLYARSEEHTSELQSLMRISYAVFCLKKKKKHKTKN